jgi:hypothetical protein
MGANADQPATKAEGLLAAQPADDKGKAPLVEPTDQTTPPARPAPEDIDPEAEGLVKGGTLVVCPMSLLAQWYACASIAVGFMRPCTYAIASSGCRASCHVCYRAKEHCDTFQTSIRCLPSPLAVQA